MTGPQDGGERAVPYVCPFCGEEDLRPAEQGRWHCRSCLRVFSLGFHGTLSVTTSSSPHPVSATPTPTPATGIRLPVGADNARADALTQADDPSLAGAAPAPGTAPADPPDDHTRPGSPR